MNPQSKTQSKTLIATLVISFLLVTGVVGYVLVNRWHENEMNRVQHETEQKYTQAVSKMEADMTELQEQRDEDPDGLSDQASASESETTLDCTKAEAEVSAFFAHLDTQPYIKAQDLKGGSAEFFNTCASLLLKNPPTNVAEMSDLDRLTKNVAHFYRILGSQVLLAREILVSESKAIEPAMASFYTHLVECKQTITGKGKPLPLEGLYDYAAYFLNTLGGRSYLMRQDSRISTLITYYAILVVDLANDEHLNPYGLDLRPHISTLSRSLSTQTGLVYRDRYQSKLTALKDKYR
ncbi:hypothetical protein LJC71_07240 [Desulfosarcina sp. OttesenSCG-928-A07]|nr:hypothetical protein [Desulfosarcina sp. OttesenSCG-928-G17]MDL2329519.1 hypothetical protein [Desulfosarcina sp. OttesenSCG-928-A07]